VPVRILPELTVVLAATVTVPVLRTYPTHTTEPVIAVDGEQLTAAPTGAPAQAIVDVPPVVVMELLAFQALIDPEQILRLVMLLPPVMAVPTSRPPVMFTPPVPL
jgi:hypothetical protein